MVTKATTLKLELNTESHLPGAASAEVGRRFVIEAYAKYGLR